jgi:hypothetical protein
MKEARHSGRRSHAAGSYLHQGISIAVDIEANIRAGDRGRYASKLRGLAEHAQHAASAIEAGNDEEACLHLVLFWLRSDTERNELVEIFQSALEQKPRDEP